MLCPNTNSFQTRVPHGQHPHPFSLLLSPSRSLVHSRTPLSPTPAGICGFALLSLDISVAPHAHLKDVRPCQDLTKDRANPPASCCPLLLLNPQWPHICLCTLSWPRVTPCWYPDTPCRAPAPRWPVCEDLMEPLSVVTCSASGSQWCFTCTLRAPSIESLLWLMHNCSYYQPT